MMGGSRSERCAAIGILSFISAFTGPTLAGDAHPLLGVLETELTRSRDKLVADDGSKPYFIQYAVSDMKYHYVAASLGSITSSMKDHTRSLDTDLRVGDYTLDNTRQIRGEGFGDMPISSGWTSLPLNDDPIATRHAIWLRTDSDFKAAVKRLAEVNANLKVKVEEEDKSDDFSREEPVVHIGPWLEQSMDLAVLESKVRQYSAPFRKHPLIYGSSVSINGTVTNRLVVNTEGSKLQSGRGWWRIGVQASTIAEDGMELWQYTSFDAFSPDGLPDDATVMAGVEQVIKDVLDLRNAPLVEPYTGPAILKNRATGVFFHEIFGHRIEGHRQKGVEEGQTFAKKLGEEVLPKFLSVTDDPSMKEFGGIELNGYFDFDDECVAGQPTNLVVDGVLKTFLMSRAPTRGVMKSNGHGRRQSGFRVVSRQGNLTIESKKQVPFDQLTSMLREQCREQGKEYGLFFDDISGGFTNTSTYGPQAFKVLPIKVFKVYADERPMELVRGVDIVGTPLTCFSKILATGDDPGVFNGVCGAESGSVPVSAIAPSILVEQIEVERKERAQDRPPILTAPIAAVGVATESSAKK